MTYMNVIFINGLPVRLRRQWKLFSTHWRSSMAMVNQVNYCRCVVGCCVCSWSSIPTIISNPLISIPFWYEAWILCHELMCLPLILPANALTEFSSPSLRLNKLFCVIYRKLRVRRTSMVIHAIFLAKVLTWLDSVTVFDYGDLDLYSIQYMTWYLNQNNKNGPSENKFVYPLMEWTD